MQKMEDECLDNLNKEFTSGWKRLKTLNKSSKKKSPPLKKLKVQKSQLKVTPPAKTSRKKAAEASVSHVVRLNPALSRTETVVRDDTVVENEATTDDDTVETVVDVNNSNLNIVKNSITKRVPYVHITKIDTFEQQIPQLIRDNMTQSEYSVFEPNDGRKAGNNRSNEIFQSKEIELVANNTSVDDDELFSMQTQKVTDVEDLNISYEDIFKKIERKIAKDMSGAKASVIKSLIQAIQPLLLNLDAIVKDNDYYNIHNWLIKDGSTQTDFNHEVQTESRTVQTEALSVTNISTQTQKTKCEVCTLRENTRFNDKCIQTVNDEMKSVFVQTNKNAETITLSENLDDFNFSTQQLLEANVSKPRSPKIKILQNIDLTPPKKNETTVDTQDSITGIMENFDITTLDQNKKSEEKGETQESISQIMDNLSKQSHVLESDVIVIDDTEPEPQPSTSKDNQVLSADDEDEKDVMHLKNARSLDRLMHSTPLNANKRKRISMGLSAIKANDDPLLNALIEASLQNESENDLLLTVDTQPKKRSRRLSFAQENSNKNFKRIRTLSPDSESDHENKFKRNNKRFMQDQLMVEFDTQSQARSPLTKIQLSCSSDSEVNMDLVEEIWRKFDKGLIGKSPKKNKNKMSPKKKGTKKSDNIQDLLNKCDMLVNNVTKKLNKPPSVDGFDDKENDIEEAMANFKSAESVKNKNATVVIDSDEELFQSDAEVDVIEGTPTKSNVKRTDRTITPPFEFQDFVDKTLVPTTPPKRSIIDSPIVNTQSDAFSPITNLMTFKNLQMPRFMSRSFVEKKCSTPKTQSNQLSLKTFMKKNKQEEKVNFERKKPNVACTRLVKEQIVNIMALAQKKLITYSSGFSEKVTHMIVNTNEENQVKDDTIKYVNAVASGAWVLNYQWIKDCLKRNEIIPELSYEVLDSSGLPGPKDSRLYRKLKPLFRGFKIHAAPPFTSTTKEDLENVITKLGGKVVKYVDEFLEKDGDICLIVTESSNTQQFNLYGDWLETLKVITVDLEWLSRSVGQYKLVSVRKYALCPDEAICDLGYPDELMVLEATQPSFM